MNTNVFADIKEFGWLNYTIFGAMLVMSALIGVLVGCCGKKQKTIEEYMLGGRTISFLLIAISLITSHVSAITLIGVPTEVYLYGILYWLLCPSMIVVGFITIRVFIPVYWSLKVTTMQQYLELRFSKRMRIIGTILYFINTILFLPILIYGPSLAFSQVSGINLHIISTIVCIVCTFYTMLGGFKGIVWADVLQALIMLCSCLTWVMMGTWNAGGVATVWRRAKEGGRLQIFEMDPSPFQARTFWTMTLGNIGLWTSNSATNPLMVQRFVAVSSLGKTKKSVILYCLGIIFVNTMSVYTGLIIYSLYADCDPIASGAISKHDQLMPYFIMDTVGHIPGLPGLFIAAIFSSALSALSAAMNALSGVLYEDLIMKIFTSRIKYNPHVYIKFIVLLIGIFCLAMTFVVDKLGELIELALSLNGITSGTMLGLYLLGMTCPWANCKGALVGVFSGLLVLTTISGGAQLTKFTNNVSSAALNTSIQGCAVASNFSATLTNATTISEVYNRESNIASSHETDDQFVLFKLSFVYYTLLGAIVVIVTGVIASLATGSRDIGAMDPDLIAPPFQFLLPYTPRKDNKANTKLLSCDEVATRTNLKDVNTS